MIPSLIDVAVNPGSDAACAGRVEAVKIDADAYGKGKSRHVSSKVAGGKSNDKKSDADAVDTDLSRGKA